MDPNTAAEVMIWYADEACVAEVDETGTIFVYISGNAERVSWDDLGWTEHQYKSFAGVLRALGQVA